jgi:hypothetical protein
MLGVGTQIYTGLCKWRVKNVLRSLGVSLTQGQRSFWQMLAWHLHCANRTQVHQRDSCSSVEVGMFVLSWARKMQISAPSSWDGHLHVQSTVASCLHPGLFQLLLVIPKSFTWHQRQCMLRVALESLLLWIWGVQIEKQDQHCCKNMAATMCLLPTTHATSMDCLSALCCLWHIFIHLWTKQGGVHNAQKFLMDDRFVSTLLEWQIEAPATPKLYNSSSNNTEDNQLSNVIAFVDNLWKHQLPNHSRDTRAPMKTLPVATVARGLGKKGLRNNILGKCKETASMERMKKTALSKACVQRWLEEAS